MSVTTEQVEICATSAHAHRVGIFTGQLILVLKIKQLNVKCIVSFLCSETIVFILGYVFAFFVASPSMGTSQFHKGPQCKIRDKE